MKFVTAVGYLLAIISSHQSEAVVHMTGSFIGNECVSGLEIFVDGDWRDFNHYHLVTNVGCELAAGSSRKLEAVTADSSTNYFLHEGEQL